MRKKLGTRFPASRIKKIMQADEDVGKIALAVPLLVCPKWGIQHDDCRRLLSVLYHQEKDRRRKMIFLLSNKLKYLKQNTRLPSTWHASEGYMKKLKIHKYVAESSLRSDDVSSHNIEYYMETSSRISNGDQGRHHVVVDYLELFDIYNTETVKFFKLLSSALNNLRLDVLYNVTKITTGNKIPFGRTRAAMKKVIEDNLPQLLLQLDYESRSHSETVKKLSMIFRDPGSFRKHLTLVTPVTPFLLASIRKIVDELDRIPFQCLLAMDRKMNSEKIIPELFTNLINKKKMLVKRVRKKCNDILLKLVEGDELPTPLGKALSMISLYKKKETRRDDILTTEFFPFTPKTEELQMEILKAIWSLPEVGRRRLRNLQKLLDPNGKYSTKASKDVITYYLMDYLFESCEIDVPIPDSFLRVIKLINLKPKKLDICHKQIADEELEAMLALSSQFKQIVWDSVHCNVIDANMKESDDEYVDSDSENDDIAIFDNEKCSDVDESGSLHHVSFLDMETEVVDESEDVDLTTIIGHQESSLQALEAKNIIGVDNCVPKFDHDADRNGSQPRFKLSDEANPLNTPFKTSGTKVVDHDNIQAICDETSILACSVISHIMEKFQEVKQPKNLEKENSNLLACAVEELVPTLPKSYIEILNELTGHHRP